MPEFWLDAKLQIVAKDDRDAKDHLDKVLSEWARKCVDSGFERGLMFFDRTGLCEEEDK